MVGIAINFERAKDCLDKLNREAHALIDFADRVMYMRFDDAQFGKGLPSGEVAAARTAYRNAVVVIYGNLGTHGRNVEVLAVRLESAMARYLVADEESAAAMALPPDEPTPSSGASVPGETDGGLPPPSRGPHPPHSVQLIDTYRTELTSYDLPRLARALEGEGDTAAYEQPRTLDDIALILEEHQKHMIALSDELAEAWSPQVSKAAEAFQDAMNDHAEGVSSTIRAAQQSADAIDDIVSTLKNTKEEITQLNQRWYQVTTDFLPFSWDQTAAELNSMATERLKTAEASVRDARQGIVIPVKANALEPGAGGLDDWSGIRIDTGFSVPPIPGRNPVDGPVLAGVDAPVAVPMSTNNPPSMLPVPPGVNPLAPNGGAWLLPGPGVGTEGRLMPMPQAGRAGIGGATLASTGAASPGIVVGGPTTGVVTGAGSAGGAGAGTAGGGDTAAAGGGKAAAAPGRERWEVRQGVKPLIESPAKPKSEAERVVEDDFGFDAWFAKTATPWEA